MRKHGIFLLMLIGLILPSFVLAQTANDTVYIGPDDTVSYNLVRVAKQITVKGQVLNDVIFIGQDATVTGTVTGDVLGAAEEWSIDGVVNGNVRVIGQTVELNGKIGKNVMVAASSVIIGPTAEISGSLDVWAENLNIKGKVVGPVYGAVKNSDISGSTGLVNLSKPAPPESWWHKYTTADYWWSRIRTLFSLLAVAIVVFALAHRLVAYACLELWQKSGRALTAGVAMTFLTPVVALVLLFTVIGIPLAAVLLLLVVAVLYIGQVVSAYFVGQWIWLQLKLKWDKSFYPQLIAGMVALVILGSLPWAGVAVTWLSVWWGAGAIFFAMKNLLWPPRREEKTEV